MSKISSAEVRECIKVIFTDQALGILFGQHVIWEDADKQLDPDTFISRARDNKAWVRTCREKSLGRGIMGWKRVYKCKLLEGIKPDFCVEIYVSEDETLVYRVLLSYLPPGATQYIKREIDKAKAFPGRAK